MGKNAKNKEEVEVQQQPANAMPIRDVTLDAYIAASHQKMQNRPILNQRPLNPLQPKDFAEHMATLDIRLPMSPIVKKHFDDSRQKESNYVLHVLSQEINNLQIAIFNKELDEQSKSKLVQKIKATHDTIYLYRAVESSPTFFKESLTDLSDKLDTAATPFITRFNLDNDIQPQPNANANIMNDPLLGNIENDYADPQ